MRRMRRAGSGGFGLGLGVITIALILINAVVFFGVQGQDTAKVYDSEWSADCISHKLCDGYIVEGYCCPNEACEITGGWVECDSTNCEKISEGTGSECTYTETDGFGLIPIKAFERPWTFITSMFMHVGVEHLMGNMIFLFFLGSILERVVGARNFLIIYFFSGLCAGMLVLFAPELGLMGYYDVVMGASGAIFGVVGALVVLRPMQTIYLQFFMPMPMIVFGLLYIGFELYMMMTVGDVGIAHSAHFGGAVGGLIIGAYFRMNKKYIQPG
ncbi:MAG: hypothetical protein A7316_11210 [Candidatus Altiarchaeales archaeon WOR_SM1_86-2]|nr:MAG: hypothetical protein A7316_11210 [Candidatus Altiarchaeales archaeon WOR_SM1_86-2]ODS39727.1 MAG: hypothetical protein A7315_10615 [Candidatus Altiarchaeales archaeon WOR_SM1_79]